MNKLYLNYLIDLGLLVSFLIVFITGLIKFPGLLRTIGLQNVYLLRAEVSLYHDWFGLILGILVLIHLALNWGWLVNVTKKIFKGGK